MPLVEGTTLLDFLTLTSPTPNTYTTTTLSASGPARAFGGCTIAFAIAAASASAIPQNFHCFSVLGNFLGPALADRILSSTVTHIRNTRSFCTRYVQVTQRLDDGSTRTVMAVLADFQALDQDAHETFNYSEPPSRVYSGVATALPQSSIAASLLSRGLLTPAAHAAIVAAKPDMRSRSIESLHCPEGVLGQTAGLAVSGSQVRIPTSQDMLPMHARTSADWFRSRVRLQSKAQQWGFVAFVVDGPTGWVPLLHDQRGLAEFEAVASLEFALRFFVPAAGVAGVEGVEGDGRQNESDAGRGGSERDQAGKNADHLDCNNWHLREFKSTAASSGRTFYEGKVWDGKGRLVASFTQQDIARPKRRVAGGGGEGKGGDVKL